MRCGGRRRRASRSGGWWCEVGGGLGEESERCDGERKRHGSSVMRATGESFQVCNRRPYRLRPMGLLRGGELFWARPIPRIKNFWP